MKPLKPKANSKPTNLKSSNPQLNRSKSNLSSGSQVPANAKRAPPPSRSPSPSRTVKTKPKQTKASSTASQSIQVVAESLPTQKLSPTASEPDWNPAPLAVENPVSESQVQPILQQATLASPPTPLPPVVSQNEWADVKPNPVDTSAGSSLPTLGPALSPRRPTPVSTSPRRSYGQRNDMVSSSEQETLLPSHTSASPQHPSSVHFSESLVSAIPHFSSNVVSTTRENWTSCAPFPGSECNLPHTECDIALPSPNPSVVQGICQSFVTLKWMLGSAIVFGGLAWFSWFLLIFNSTRKWFLGICIWTTLIHCAIQIAVTVLLTKTKDHVHEYYHGRYFDVKDTYGYSHSILMTSWILDIMLLALLITTLYIRRGTLQEIRIRHL